MSGPIGTAMTTTNPVVSSTAGPTWATMVNDRLTEIEAYLEAKLANASLDLGTEADVKHGARTRLFWAGDGQSALTRPLLATPWWEATGATDQVLYPLNADINQRITGISLRGRCAGVTAWTFKAYKIDLTTGTTTQLGSTQTSNTAAAIEKLTVSGLTETVAEGIAYFALWTSGAASNRSLGGDLVLDRVAV